MTYRIVILPSARNELAALAVDMRKRVDVPIMSLATNLRPPGVKVIRGHKGLCRDRVVIVRIGHRREVYRGL